MNYPIVITPLSNEDGGGYLAFFPDLVGCMSDGETPEEATKNALLAFDEWMDAAKERGIDIPAPHSAEKRAAKERDELFAAIRSIRAHHDEMDERLDELERMIVDIQEQISEAESWTRFGSIVGTPTMGQITVRRTVLIEN